MRMSVVIPVKNAAGLVERQLEALAAQDFDGWWEVVVADNGSTDATPAVVERWRDRLPLRLVDASDAPGSAHARNVGARAAGGDFLLFCDADDEVAPGWLAAMARAAERCPALGGRLDEDSLNDPVVVAWRGRRLQDDLTRPPGFLPHPQGANCGVRADVFHEVGGFEERYGYGSPDVELFWRVQLASHRVCFVPDAVVRYRHRPGLRALARQQFMYGRSLPRLYRDFRRFGMPRASVRTVVATWAWLVRHAGDLFRSEVERGVWLRIAANRAGRVAGSVRYRVVCL